MTELGAAVGDSV